LDGAPLDYEPQNELGVVFLFAALARKKFGLRVDRIQADFRDCIAYQGDRRVRVEFEYRSRSFAVHHHNPRRCDWIVCWIHDWAAAPSHIRVVELRKQYGLGFNVWVNPVARAYWDGLVNTRSAARWTVAPGASEGDLLLYYHSSPCCHIKEVFRIDGPIVLEQGGRWNRRGKDWFARVRRVRTLKAPVHLKELKQHPILRNAGFVRSSMRGRPKVTPYWPQLCEMILDRNPGLKSALAQYGPERVL
jgi:predicted RNA-binding protein with PUA-like domain